jgi:hypothetical protein
MVNISNRLEERTVIPNEIDGVSLNEGLSWFAHFGLNSSCFGCELVYSCWLLFGFNRLENSLVFRRFCYSQEI